MHNCFLRSSQDISIHASAREATIDFIKILDAPAISIHASAREATSPHVSSANNLPYFNPRLREGGDEVFHSMNTSLKRFQSTPPRGRRHDRDFMYAARPQISIHASAREATFYIFLTTFSFTISIHASAREATALITNFYI